MRVPRSLLLEYTWAIASLLAIVLGIRSFVIEAFKIPSSSMYPTLEIGDYLFVNKFIYGLRVPFVDAKLFARTPARGDVIVFIQPCQPDRDYIKRVVALGGDTIEVRCSVLYVNGVAVPSTLVDASPCAYEDRDEGGPWSPATCSRYRETVDGRTYDTYSMPERPDEELRARQLGGRAHPAHNDFPDGFLRSCNTVPLGRPAARQQLGKLVETVDAVGPLGACKPQLHYVVPADHVFVMGDNRDKSQDSRVWGSVPIDNIKGKALFIWWSVRDWSLTNWSQIRWSRMGNFVH